MIFSKWEGKWKARGKSQWHTTSIPCWNANFWALPSLDSDLYQFEQYIIIFDVSLSISLKTIWKLLYYDSRVDGPKHIWINDFFSISTITIYTLNQLYEIFFHPVSGVHIRAPTKSDECTNLFRREELKKIIIGRPFLARGREIIDVHQGQMILRVDEERLIFHMQKLLKFPEDESLTSCFHIDLKDDLADEYMDDHGKMFGQVRYHK